MERRLQRPAIVMKRFSILVACSLLCACPRSAPRARTASAPSDIQTVDSTDARPAVLDPPPVLTDEGPAPKPKGNVLSEDAPPPPTAQDEALRASLPFAPAIALDPVDGSKISIRAGTPVADYKGHFFYFSSEANKRTFLASPDQFLKGAFAHL
jgi:YHS domain-containing protein